MEIQPTGDLAKEMAEYILEEELEQMNIVDDRKDDPEDDEEYHDSIDTNGNILSLILTKSRIGSIKLHMGSITTEADTYSGFI